MLSIACAALCAVIFMWLFANAVGDEDTADLILCLLAAVILAAAFIWICYSIPENLVRDVYSTEENGAIGAGPWYVDETDGKTL